MRKFYLSVISFLLAVFLLVIFFRPINAIDEDLGRHILIGDIIIATKSVPTINLLTYTNYNFPSYPASWLSEVVFSLVNKAGGFNLLLILNTLVGISAVLVMLNFVKKRYGIEAILISSTFYLILLFLRTDVRPEIFSMLFISIFVTTLYEFREKVSKKIFALFLIQMLWVNMHIYFFIGPLLVLVFLLENLKLNKFHFNYSSKLLLSVFFLTVIATFINPMGLMGAIYPFTVHFNYGVPVTENQDILMIYKLFLNRGVFYPLVVIACLFFVLVVGRKRVRPVDVILSVVISLSFFVVYRNILLFIFATFIPFTNSLDEVVKRFLSKIKNLPKQTFLSLYPLSIVLLVVCILQVVTLQSVGFGVLDSGKESADFFIKNKIKGPIFNSFDIGGYLAYRLYPQLLYVDNRPEFFPASFFEKIVTPMKQDPLIFESEDRKYKFNAIFVNHWTWNPWENKFFKYLIKEKDFSLVYLDSYAFIFVRKTDKNRELIHRNHIARNEISIDKINDPGELLKYLFFFEKIGWKKEARIAVLRLREFDSELCILKKYRITSPVPVSFLNKNEIKNICPSGNFFGSSI